MPTTPKKKKPVTITKAMQRKITSAVNAEKKKMEKEFEKRVQLRVKEYVAKYMPDLEDKRAELAKKIETYDNLNNKKKAIFTANEYKQILMCLHTDGERTKERLHDAFVLFNSKAPLLKK
jgi:uncharacterized protein YeeX (DUF496 family)